MWNSVKAIFLSIVTVAATFAVIFMIPIIMFIGTVIISLIIGYLCYMPDTKEEKEKEANQK